MFSGIPSGLVYGILVLAPVILGFSIFAHLRLLRLVRVGPEPIATFLTRRWNSALIVGGGAFLLREALLRSTAGSMAQICGVVLATEFLYVAYANLRVAMSSGGLLLGMSFSPWRRFAGYEWLDEGRLELRSRTGRRFRMRVPDRVRAQVQEIVDLNILR